MQQQQETLDDKDLGKDEAPQLSVRRYLRRGSCQNGGGHDGGDGISRGRRGQPLFGGRKSKSYTAGVGLAGRGLAGHFDSINQLAGQKKEKLRSKAIDKVLLAEQEAKKREVQLLMIGGSGCGKSTLVRQLRIHHGDAFPDEKRREMAPLVLQNLADGVQIVLANMRSRDAWFSDEYVRDMAEEFLAYCPRFNRAFFRVPSRLAGIADSIHYARVEYADADWPGGDDEKQRRLLCRLEEIEDDVDLVSSTNHADGSESPSLIFYYEMARNGTGGDEPQQQQHPDDASSEPASSDQLDSQLPSYTSTLDFALLRRQLEEAAEAARVPQKSPWPGVVVAHFARHLKNITAQPEFEACLEDAEYFKPEITYAELYFIRQVDRLIQDDYIPSLQDILAIRQPNLSVSESHFLVGGCTFRIIDLAGHRRHRCKWLHYFEEVSAVLFVSSLTGFAELAEDGDRITVKMTECLALFAEIANNRHLSKKDLFLFLNKLDLFEQALKKKSIAGLFPDYRGHDEVSESSSFIKEKFLSLLPKNQPKTKRVFAHVVSAVDIEGMRSAFGEVLRRIADANLKRTLHVF